MEYRKKQCKLCEATMVSKECPAIYNSNTKDEQPSEQTPFTVTRSTNAQQSQRADLQALNGLSQNIKSAVIDAFFLTVLTQHPGNITLNAQWHIARFAAVVLGLFDGAITVSSLAPSSTCSAS